MIGVRRRLQDQFGVDEQTATMVLAVAAITLVAIALGLWLDFKNFALNLLGGVAGLGVAVIGGVLLFERVADKAALREQQARLADQEKHRRERWEGVRTATLTALWDQLRRVTKPIMILSPEYQFAGGHAAAIGVMQDVLAWVKDQAVDPTVSPEWWRFRARLLSLEQNLHQEYLPIRNVLIPRVLEYADDADLVRLLLVLDTKERRFAEWVFIAASGPKELGTSYTEGVWRRMQAFLEAAIDVAAYIQPRRARGDSDTAARLPDQPWEGLTTVMGGDGRYHTVTGD